MNTKIKPMGVTMKLKKLSYRNAFYHVTELENLENIIKHNGLYSLENMVRNNIPFTPISNDISWNCDYYKNIANFVKLSFNMENDMIKSKMYKRILKNPVILIFSNDIVDLPNTKYCYGNSAKSDSYVHNISEMEQNMLNAIYDISNKHSRQSELLIENHLNLKYLKYIVLPKNATRDIGLASFFSGKSITFLENLIKSTL